MRILVLVYLLAASIGYCASIEGASFEMNHPNLTLTKTTVIGASAVGAPGRPFAPTSIDYHCRLEDAFVWLSEGAISLPAGSDSQEKNLWSRRHCDEHFSEQTYVFRGDSSWSVIFMIGPPVRDDRNITQGLCLLVRAPSSASAASVLKEVASALVIFVGQPLAPKRISDLDAMSMIVDVSAFLGGTEPNHTAKQSTPSRAGSP